MCVRVCACNGCVGATAPTPTLMWFDSPNVRVCASVSVAPCAKASRDRYYQNIVLVQGDQAVVLSITNVCSSKRSILVVNQIRTYLHYFIGD